jgi:succinoglycan biosynthesis transport protein ExoP
VITPRYPPQLDDPGSRQLTGQPEPELRDLVMALRRHALLIAGSVMLCLGLGAAYTLRAIPVFEASAMVRFEAERLDLPQLVQLPYTDNLISTEMEVLKGRSAAVAVINSLGLRARLLAPRRGQVSKLFSTLRVATSTDAQTLVFTPHTDGTFTISRPNAAAVLGTVRVGDTTRIAGVLLALTPAAAALPELRLHIDPLDGALATFQSALAVSRPAHDADLIAIKVRDGDPARAAAAANLMAANLIADRQLAHNSRTDAAVAFLEQQDDSLGKQLHASEDSLRAYQERAHVIDAPQQATAEVARLAKLQADLAGVRAERDAFAALVNEFHNDTTGGVLGGQAASRRLMAFPSLLANQSAAVLLGSLAQVEAERSQLLIRRMPADSDVQVLTRRIRDMESQLQEIAESYLQGLSNQVTSLEGEAHKFSTQLDALPEKEVQTARRERDTKVLNDLWVLVQTRLKEAQISGAGGDQTVRIADAATAPVQPARPRKINMALSLVLGCLIGFTGALAREHGDRAVRSREDARSISGLPVLGAFPRLRLRKGARALLPRIGAAESVGPIVPTGTAGHMRDRTAAAITSLLVTQPNASGAYVESFNQLFANLALSYREKPLKVVVFTSALPGEGKTLSAINFALVGASRGLKVLLIDADLRCGLVHSVLGCRRGPGFAELLAGTAEASEVMRPLALADNVSLVVMPSGELPKVPGRVLTIDRVRAVLGGLTPRFDFVVIDTPPVNLLADAAVLGSAADAVLLVVRAGHTQADELRFAMDQLEGTGAPVLGTLLNDIDLRRDAGYDGSYRYIVDAERYSVSAS